MGLGKGKERVPPCASAAPLTQGPAAPPSRPNSGFRSTTNARPLMDLPLAQHPLSKSVSKPTTLCCRTCTQVQVNPPSGLPLGRFNTGGLSLLAVRPAPHRCPIFSR